MSGQGGTRAWLRRGVAQVDRFARLRALERLGVRLDIGAAARVNVPGIGGQPGAVLQVGAGTLLDGDITFERAGAQVRIGARTFVNGHVAAAQEVVIGDDVLVAWGTTIVDHDSHAVAFSKRRRDVELWTRSDKDWTHVKVAPVRISHKAWIGMHAIILKGVTIGEGAVVGAGAVVTKSVGPWTVVAGNPAKPIRVLSDVER